jgi:hypothetical protein
MKADMPSGGAAAMTTGPGLRALALLLVIPANAAKLVADALADADGQGRLLLLSVLSGLGSKAGGVVDKVRPLTKDTDPRVAKTAAELVKRFDPR